MNWNTQSSALITSITNLTDFTVDGTSCSLYPPPALGSRPEPQAEQIFSTTPILSYPPNYKHTATLSRLLAGRVHLNNCSTLTASLGALFMTLRRPYAHDMHQKTTFLTGNARLTQLFLLLLLWQPAHAAPLDQETAQLFTRATDPDKPNTKIWVCSLALQRLNEVP